MERTQETMSDILSEGEDGNGEAGAVEEGEWVGVRGERTKQFGSGGILQSK